MLSSVGGLGCSIAENSTFQALHRLTVFLLHLTCNSYCMYKTMPDTSKKLR